MPELPYPTFPPLAITSAGGSIPVSPGKASKFLVLFFSQLCHVSVLGTCIYLVYIYMSRKVDVNYAGFCPLDTVQGRTLIVGIPTGIHSSCPKKSSTESKVTAILFSRPSKIHKRRYLRIRIGSGSLALKRAGLDF